MPSYIRPRINGATIFFTVNLMNRGSSLLTDEVELLRDAVAATRAERPFKIDAWVVLPDHLHAVWTLPPGDHDYSTRWGAIKARFSKSLGRRAGFTPPSVAGPVPTHLQIGRNGGKTPTLRADKGEVGIWQRRFWEHHIRDDDDYIAHVQYCWFNPVKHGYVTRPEDWPWSSVHRDQVKLAGYGGPKQMAG